MWPMARKKKNTISDQLRAAVEASPMSRYEICKQTGLDKGLLSRFVHGESGLSFRSLDTLCELLKLELRPVRAKAPKPRRTASKANTKAKRPIRKKAKRPTQKGPTKKGGK